MLVWLQGGPSTGKSSISRRMLRAGREGEAWFVTGDDYVTTQVPRWMLAPREPDAAPPLDGWDIRVLDGRLVQRPRAGPSALRILEGLYRGAAAMAAVGVHVILDDVVWERAVLDIAEHSMRDVPRLVIEVSCTQAIALERERVRTDRRPGAVEAYASELPLVAHPDLRIDASARTPVDCADEIVEIVRGGLIKS